MNKTFRYRIYPNKDQQVLIQKTIGCCRFVYNYYLDKRIKKYEHESINFTYNMCCKDLTQLKKEYVWLKEVDSTALQAALKQLDLSFEQFFMRHTGFPKFRSKKMRHKSYTTKNNHDCIKFLGNRIQIPKIGKIKIKDKQIPNGRILNAIITQERDGRYYCSLCCTDVQSTNVKQTGKCVGIDLGVIDFAIFSDGAKIPNPHFYEQSEDKITKLQRELDRKEKGSSNREKARIKLAKMHGHIANQRKDFLQKLTTNIVKQFDVICIEDLAVHEMMTTGNSIRNKRVRDVSWAGFRKMLEYKCQFYNKTLVVVDRFFPSSQICSACGHRDEKKLENIREWICPCCGAVLDRDINAAVNILNEGIRMLNNTDTI